MKNIFEANTIMPADYTQAHMDAIKNRLLIAKRKFEEKEGLSKPLTAYAIHKYFTDNNRYTITHPMLKNLLTPGISCTYVNITIIAQLCKLFNVSLDYVLALPEEQPILPDNSAYDYDFKRLTDPFYLGSFTCYMLRTAYVSDENAVTVKNDTLRKNDELVKCSLKIENINNYTTAEMIIHNHTTHVDGKHIFSDTKLSGLPIHISKTDNIFINFISEHGKYYTVMFDHQVFYNAPMYFREAVVMTSSTGTQTLPMISKMIILRNDVPQQYHDYLRGLLSLNVNNIIISEDKLNQLKTSNSEIKQFCSEFEDYLKLYLRPFYVIPESLIEHNPRTTMTSLDLKKILLLLRNHSYSLAQIEIGKDSKASIIGKEIQQYYPDEEISI